MSERPKLRPAEGLVKDRLPPPPPRKKASRPASAPVSQDNDNADTPGVPTALEAPSAVPMNTTAKGAKGGSEVLKKTSVNLPLSLLARLRERVNSLSMPQVEFLLTAIEEHQHRLAELVENERPRPKPGALFLGSSPGRHLGDQVIWTVRISERNLQVIDSLVERSGADSRAQLIQAVLRAALSH